MNWRVKVERRVSYPRFFPTMVLLFSLLGGFVLIGLLFLISHVNPIFALWKIFSGSFGSLYGITETITKAIPLILIGSGLALVFRAKFWNIGAEGQLLIGAIFAGYVALNLGPKLPFYVVVPLMFVVGFIGGALWALPTVILKLRFNVNEVISTLMLNYIAAELLNFLITGPWKGKTQMGFPYTDDFPHSAVLSVVPGTRIHLVTLCLALLFAFALFIMVYYTRFGYELRVTGDNPDAARYAGIDFMKVTLIMMIISGGVAGIAGVGEVAGIHHHLSYPSSISSGYGYTAIIVAWLAKLNPLLTILSGLFFAGIVVGGDAIQVSLGLPAATVQIFNGILLFSLIMGDYFLNHRVKLVVREAP